VRFRDSMGCLSMLFGVASTFVAGVFTVVSIYRFSLTYNEQGRYFDPTSSVVYDESARVVYAVLALICWLAAAVFFGIRYWSRRSKTSSLEEKEADGR